MTRWPPGQPTLEFAEYRAPSLRAPAEGEPLSVPVVMRVLASRDGIVITDEPRRVFGYRQLRARAKMLHEAADFAESRGCPDYLVES